MLKKVVLAASILLFVAACATSTFGNHAYVASIPTNKLNEDLFRVQVEQVNGHESNSGPNHRVPVGENTINLSLVYNSSWGKNMETTQGRIYYKEFKLNAEAGKTYFIGAKVNRSASTEEQRAGTFWEPVIVND